MPDINEIKGKIVVAANRLPVNITKRSEGFEIRQSPGGLAAGLRTLQKKGDVRFVGWPGYWTSDNEERKEIEEKLIKKHRCFPVFIHPSEVKKYYYGFSNKTLWPLFHYFSSYSSYDQSEWESYRHINQKFFQTLLEVADPHDLFWIHDYHLMLLPSLLRKGLPQSSIGFFLHIPFPSSEIFRLLPWRREFLEGMLGADLIGFHTYEYSRHFLSSVLRLLGLEHEYGGINIDDRLVKVQHFPMGVDIRYMENLLEQPEVEEEIKSIKRDFNAQEKKLILSVDRLDYSKGIPNRLEGLELFLENYPEWHNRFVYVMLCVPSRTKVRRYSLLKEEVDRLVGRINGRFGRQGWIPVHYMYRSLPFEKLLPFYAAADAALVTPLRDGMNLVAKEFAAAQINNKGVLILSETAGAAFELGESLLVNINDKNDLASALDQALRMSAEEQETRMKKMRARLGEGDIYHWVQSFVKGIQKVKSVQEKREQRKLRGRWKSKLMNEYKAAGSRLFLLGCDGTLASSSGKTTGGDSDTRFIRVLKMLSDSSRNTLVLTSEQERLLLDRSLGELPCGLVAENGAWVKKAYHNGWQNFNNLANGWKKEIRPIFKDYASCVPGSFIREKEHGIAWEYGRADPELGKTRAGELYDYLSDFLTGKDHHVIHGRKVVEVRNAEINKGRGILPWLIEKQWDFILAVGESWTDEDVFKTLPSRAYSVRITFGPTEAKYFVDSSEEALELLLELAKM